MQPTNLPKEHTMNHTAEIKVTGHGLVSAMPDAIQISITVISKKPDYPQTLAHLNERVSAIGRAVSRAGTPEKVFTKSYSIEEVWSDPYDLEKRVFQGYEATQKMNVTTPLDNALLGRIVNGISECKAAPSLRIAFVVKNFDALKKAARIEAAHRAKEAAQDLAGASALQLVSIRSIDFSDSRVNGGDYGLSVSALAQLNGPSAPEIEPDVVSHEEVVHMVWLATSIG